VGAPLSSDILCRVVEVYPYQRTFLLSVTDSNQLLDDSGFVDHRRLPRSCPVDIALAARNVL
jgi:hypothetical protein